MPRGAWPQNLPNVSGALRVQTWALPPAGRSSQGRRSLGTRRLRAAAPPGCGGAGTPRAGEGSTWQEKVRAACGLWRQVYPPNTGSQPLHGCAPGPGHGSRIRGVARDAGVGRGRGRRDRGVAGTHFQSSTLCTQVRAPGLRRLPEPDLGQGLANPRRSVSPTGAAGTHSPSVPKSLRQKHKGDPLVVQWLRLWLLLLRKQVPSLV